MGARLPAHLEASAIIRAVESQGGFATVLARGHREAGTLLLLIINRGKGGVLYERMPQLDGARPFVAAKRYNPENPSEMTEYLERRRAQDPDIWIIEADIADPAQLIASLASQV